MPASSAKGHRQRVLHQGPARHRGIAITIRLESRAANRLLKQGLSGIQRPAQLERQSGVDGVLAGSAPVNVARSLGISRLPGPSAVSPAGWPDCRLRCRLAQRGKIDGLVAAGRHNWPDRFRRHHPAGGLRLRQRRFKIRHALHPLRVAEPVG